MYPRPPTTMINREAEPLISRGSAATSSSKRTDLCVPGVFTTSGVVFKDRENIEEDGDADPDIEEASIASVRLEVKTKLV
jgi:hypothetical protein